MRHKILLAAWTIGGGQGIVVNDKITPLFPELPFSKSVRKKINDIIFSIKHKKGKLPDNGIIRRYEDTLYETVLDMVEDHIHNDNYSLAFMRDALTLASTTYGTKEGQLACLERIIDYMNLPVTECWIRRLLFGCLYTIYIEPMPVQDFVDDSDAWIGFRAVWWCVMKGEKKFLPKYVRLTWAIYGNQSMKGDHSSWPVVFVDPQECLSHYIPDIEPLYSSSAQLDWLAENMTNLQWNAEKDIYELLTHDHEE
jgi:hypothetical protein